MTKQEYEKIENDILFGEKSQLIFRWELIKALWDLTRVIKGGIDD
jgi:hypothetical protein